jgi:hypothetical protein
MGSEIRYGNPDKILWADFGWMNTGDVMSVKILGQVIIILNSPKAAKDLLEKRGNIYSDRHLMPFYQMYAPYLPFSVSLMDLSFDQDGMGVVSSDYTVW